MPRIHTILRSILSLFLVLLIIPKNQAFAANSCSISPAGKIVLESDSLEGVNPPQYSLKFTLDDVAAGDLVDESVFLETGGGLGGQSAFSKSVKIESNSFEISIDKSIDKYQKFTDSGNHEIALHRVDPANPSQSPRLCLLKYSVNTGTCSWDIGPPLQVKESSCRSGFVPTHQGNPLAPICTCVAGDEAGSTALPPALGGTVDDPACNITKSIDTMLFCSELEKQNYSGGKKALSCTKENKTGFICDKNTTPCMNTNGTVRDPNDIVCYNFPLAKGGGATCNPKDGKDGEGGILTAIGCVPTEPRAFVEGGLRVATYASGGIALLLMILASLELITAEGNPELLNKAREKFYSAFIGLLIIIFAVLLMQIIGVDILGLPGVK